MRAPGYQFEHEPSLSFETEGFFRPPCVDLNHQEPAPKWQTLENPGFPRAQIGLLMTGATGYGSTLTHFQARACQPEGWSIRWSRRPWHIHRPGPHYHVC